MAGWTTLRLAHAPTHRPPAAHKLHRAPTTTDQIKQDKKQKTLRRTATPGPSTDTNFGASKPSQTTPISTIFPTQPSTGSKPVTFPKSPVTFAEIRTKRIKRIKPGSAAMHPGVYCLRTTLVGLDNAKFCRIQCEGAHFGERDR